MPKRRKNVNSNTLSVSTTMLNTTGKNKRTRLAVLSDISAEDHDYTSKELRNVTREKITRVEASESKGKRTFSYMKDSDQNIGGTCSKRSDHINGYRSINLVPSVKARCISKNAINARLNRLKKKSYIQSLEDTITDLMAQNEELKTYGEDQLKCINSLKTEVAYLRGVISNMSEIKSLLRTVRLHSDLKFTSSLLKDPLPNCFKEESPKVDTGMCKQNEHCNNITDTTGELSKFSETDTAINFYENLSCFDTLVDNDLLTPLSDGKFLESASDIFNGNMEDDLFCSSGTQNSINLPNVGVCFHVANKKVSLEFCAVCNENALS